MHVRPALRTLVLAGALGVVAVPAASFAGTYQHADARKDVMRQSSTSSSVTIHADPTNKTADIVRVHASYTAETVTTSVKLRDIANAWYAIGRIKTPDASYDVFAVHEQRHTQVGLTKSGSGKDVACDGLAASADRTLHKITLVVPTVCVATPASLQIGVGVVAVTKKGDFYFDDGLRTRGARERNLTLSPSLTQD